jgi:hypothetical protein
MSYHYHYFSSSIYKSLFSIRSSPQNPEKTDIVEPVLHLQLGLLALQGWLGRGEAVCHLPWHAAPRRPDSPVRATLLDAFL